VIRPQRLVLPVLTATVALVLLLALKPLSTSRALAIWIVIVAGIALLLLVRHSRHVAGASRFEAALRPQDPPSTPPVELLRMERELELGIAGAAHAHRRLLPLLRTVAAARLTSRHGVELERRPDAARALLGDEAWEWLRPDRPEPADRFATGLSRERVESLIAAVESL
jgi:hypothetical protein